MQNLIFGPALFYDIPEYLLIVNSHPFWQAITMGHFPIHPIFMGVLWILIKVFPVNIIAIIFAGFSMALIYKISKILFKSGTLPAILFAFFPAVWIINTNLLVETIVLTFYLLSIYMFVLKKYYGFLLAIFIMIGTHIESIFWIPSIFLIPFIFNEEIKLKKQDLLRFIKISLFGVFLSFLFYLLIYFVSGRSFLRESSQLFLALTSSNILQMIRNGWVTFIRSFGSLTPFILGFLFLKKIKSKTTLTAWLIFFAIIGLLSANWQGDFMPRRIVFSGVLLSLAIYKYLGKKTVYVVLYLLPIVLANVFLYSTGNPFSTFEDLPKNQVLVQSRYYQPFTKYEGKILWIGVDDLTLIDNYLENGTRVFLAKEAITAPYRQLVGNNYHITSLSKVGESESRHLFIKYKVGKYGNNLEFKLLGKDKPAGEAGEPVISYDDHFVKRLARRRIDYGDVGSWLWMFATNHRDPTGWIYKDAAGVWNYPDS